MAEPSSLPRSHNRMVLQAVLDWHLASRGGYILFCVPKIIFNAGTPKHCCLVAHTNVPQQQNIFFNRMNRPSDDSSRRIIPVQIWELFEIFEIFFWIFKNFVVDLPWKSNQSTQVKTQKSKLEKNDWFQCLNFENVHKGPRPRMRRFAICGTSSLFQSLWH